MRLKRKKKCGAVTPIFSAGGPCALNLTAYRKLASGREDDFIVGDMLLAVEAKATAVIHRGAWGQALKLSC